MSESESSDHEDSSDAEMAGNPPDISSKDNDLVQTDESSKKHSKVPTRMKFLENFPSFMNLKEW